jgi:MoxR-like ATPase
MPADILGSEILEEADSGRRSFRFIKGPVFCQLLMADEINRASPRTQSALLQAMQEHRVSVAGENHNLPRPFHVLATQNPLEHEGTYPLPEAQLDRFMFIINVDYPTMEQEVDIAMKTTSGIQQELDVVLHAEQVQELQKLVPSVPVSEHVAEYAVKLVQSSRPGKNGATPDFINEWIDWGAGPRASQYLILGAKARTLMDNRVTATIEDVQSLARQVLEHRLILNFKAQAENITTNDIIEKLLQSVNA